MKVCNSGPFSGRLHKLGYTSPPPYSGSEVDIATRDVVIAQDALCSQNNQDLSFGTALLAGISLLGVAVSVAPKPAVAAGVVAPQNLDSKVCLKNESEVVRVIVIDNFWQADAHTTHGEIVEGELIRTHHPSGEDANLAVERQHVSLWGGDHGIVDGKPGALEAHLRDHFAGRMRRDAEGLQRVLDSEGGRGVLHQSQGASESRVVDGLYYRSLRDEVYRARLQEQLKMPVAPLETNAQKAEFLSRLVQEADSMYKTDPTVLEARQELRTLQDQLHQKGFIHVVSAGNQGYLSREMTELDVEAPPGFFTNDLASEHSIVVGASDNQSKGLGNSNLGVAQLANPDAGAMIAADGVDRPIFVDGKDGHHSGSSYAAPQVSSMIAHMLRAEPELTRSDIVEQLQAAAIPVEGQERFLGVGVLDFPEILLCEKATARF